MVSAVISNIPPSVRDRPTLKDVMNEIVQIHTCVHDVGTKVVSLDSKIDDVQLDVAHLKGVQEGITIRLGVPNAPPLNEGEQEPKPVKPALLVTKSWKSFAALTGVASGGFVLLQFVFDAAPGVWAAIYHAVMAAH